MGVGSVLLLGARAIAIAYQSGACADKTVPRRCRGEETRKKEKKGGGGGAHGAIIAGAWAIATAYQYLLTNVDAGSLTTV